MHLQNLLLLNFKSYPEVDLTFSERINCFLGNNGQGKTNLLDAIHYLCFCKSYFNPIDSQNIAYDAPFFVLQGTFMLKDKPEHIYCGLKRGEKKQFKRNQKEYTRLADHIGLFPLVMISPADSELIYEGSETRRKFIDTVISQYDKEYLDALISYNKALLNRNTLLKAFAESKVFDKDTLEIWDMQMVSLGKHIHDKRKLFVDEFIPTFTKYYKMISGGKETAGIIYQSQLNNDDFALLLEYQQDKDRNLTYTSVGIHKDDLEFLLQERSIKKYGSQGQQKSFLIALKLAQFHFLKEKKKVSPIVLLDDIYDKLDEERVKKLMELINSEDFKQVFITDTHTDRLPVILKKIDANFKVYKIESGIAREN